MVNASPVLLWSFVALAIAIAGAYVVAVHASAGHTTRSSARRDTMLAALATATWLAVTLALAASGRLSFTSRPPTAGVLVVVGVGLAIAVGTSRLGARLATGIPLAALIGVQAFRFPLELMLHRAYREGLMPVQMSYSGFNFDILTGLSAIVVALYSARRPQRRSRCAHLERCGDRAAGEHPHDRGALDSDADPGVPQRAGERVDRARAVGMAAGGVRRGGDRRAYRHLPTAATRVPRAWTRTARSGGGD
jgi:hypothetical protein